MKKHLKTILTLALIFTLMPYPTLFAYNKQQLRTRIEKFYPLTDLKDYKYQNIKKLIKKGKDKQALSEIKSIYENDPSDLKAEYAYQAIKSYYLIKTKWKILKELPSPILVFNAWLAFANKSYSEAYNLAEKCYSTYYEEAVRQQSLLNFPPPESQRRFYWALNDVATSMYIMAVCLIKMHKYQDAYNLLKRIRQEFPYAFCYDFANRRFWKPEESAKKKMEMLIAKGLAKDMPVKTVASRPKKENPKPQAETKPKEPIKLAQKNTIILPPEKTTPPPKTEKEEKNKKKKKEPIEYKEPEIKEEPQQAEIEPQENNLPPEEATSKPEENILVSEEAPQPEPEETLPPEETAIQKEEKPIETPKPKKEEKPKIKTIRAEDTKKNLKQVLVFVKKGITLKWTGIRKENGMYEVIERRKGFPKKKLEFENLDEFYEYAKSLGFATNR